MARTKKIAGPVNWYLREWMDLLGVRQVDMIREAGWSKATANHLYHGIQDYSPDRVNEAAAVLKAEPYELLMPPEKAMALRRLQASAVRIAEDQKQHFTIAAEPERPWRPENQNGKPHQKRRKAS